MDEIYNAIRLGFLECFSDFGITWADNESLSDAYDIGRQWGENYYNRIYEEK